MEQYKRDRVVLLVTHSMEEAELLADNVIVMQKGMIVAAGTPLRLKAKSAAGYRLSITTTAKPEDTRPPCPSATLESSSGGEVAWRISQTDELADAVQWVYEHERPADSVRSRKQEKSSSSSDLQIDGWSVGMLSLEDVLLESKLF